MKSKTLTQAQGDIKIAKNLFNPKIDLEYLDSRFWNIMLHAPIVGHPFGC